MKHFKMCMMRFTMPMSGCDKAEAVVLENGLESRISDDAPFSRACNVGIAGRAGNKMTHAAGEPYVNRLGIVVVRL